MVSEIMVKAMLDIQFADRFMTGLPAPKYYWIIGFFAENKA
jgi:hypothetical protein